jgi:hypothetical protein
MTPSTISQIIRSPLGQAYLEGLQDKSQEAALDVRKKLIALNVGALNTIERILNPAEKAPHSVQLNAAKDVLDRTGYKAPDKLHVDMTMHTKTDEEIDAEIAAVEQSIAKTYIQDPNSPADQPGQTDQPKQLDQPNNQDQEVEMGSEATPDLVQDLGNDEFDPFINEQPNQDASTDQAIHTDNKTKMDSSGTLINPKDLHKDQSDEQCVSQCDEKLPPSDKSPEESILLDKIPANIFSNPS